MDRRFDRDDARSLAILTALAILVVFLPLGRTPVWNIDESRYAEVAREMAESHDFLVPRANGGLVAFYPPLAYWSMAFFSRCLGAFTAFSVRLPSALAALGVVWLAYFLGRLLFDRRTGFTAGVILLTMFGFTAKVAANADMLMTFFVALALYFFLRWYRSEEKSGATLGGIYVSAGLATLAKGPQAIILTSLAILSFLIYVRDLGAVGRMKPLRGIVLVSILVLPWYVAVYSEVGGDFIRAAFAENFDNFLSGPKLMHVAPPYYYLEHIFVQPFPWSVFLPSALFLLLFRKDPAEAKAGAFLIIWFVAVFLFYSLATSKRAFYLLPLYPAMALIVARFWTMPVAPSPRRDRRDRVSAIASTLPFGLLLAAVLAAAGALAFAREAVTVKFPGYAKEGPILAGALLLLAGAVVVATTSFLRAKPNRAFSVIAALLAAANLAYGWQIRRDADAEGVGGIEFCTRVKEIVGEAELFSYRRNESYFSFYTARTIRKLDDAELARRLSAGASLYLLTDRETFEGNEILSSHFKVKLAGNSIHKLTIVLVGATKT